MTTKEKAEALFNTIDIDLRDTMVPMIMQEALINLAKCPDPEYKKYRKALIRVHNYFSPPKDHIGKKDVPDNSERMD